MSDECIVTILKSQQHIPQSSKNVKLGVYAEDIKLEDDFSKESVHDPHFIYGLVVVFIVTIATLAMLVGYLFVFSY